MTANSFSLSCWAVSLSFVSRIRCRQHTRAHATRQHTNKRTNERTYVDERCCCCCIRSVELHVALHHTAPHHTAYHTTRIFLRFFCARASLTLGGDSARYRAAERTGFAAAGRTVDRKAKQKGAQFRVVWRYFSIVSGADFGQSKINKNSIKKKKTTDIKQINFASVLPSAEKRRRKKTNTNTNTVHSLFHSLSLYLCVDIKINKNN